MIVRCAPQVGRVFARNASSASSSASIVQKTYTKPLSVANVKAEAECGIHCRMSENVTVGSAPALAYDEVHHEILNSGVECKLAFTPSYSDAHQHGTNGRKLHALQHSMLAAGEDVYLHFNLYTEGITTERAIQRISAALGVPPRDISVASLKDALTASTQRASIRDCSWKQLSLLNDMFELEKDLKVGDFELKSHPVGLGEALGTRVDTCIRNAPFYDTAIDDLCVKATRVKRFGFINYNGYQRFSLGAQKQPYHVAAAMLRGAWRDAAEAVLLNRVALPEGVHEAFANNEYEAALLALPENGVWDKVRVLLGEMIASGDARNAVLASLSRLSRAHCLSSLQAYVWNEMASARIKLGHTVLVGDLVTEEPGVSIADNTAVHTVRSAKEARRYSLQNVVLPMPGVVYDAEGLPQPCVYPEIEGVSRDSLEALLLQKFDLSVSIFEEAMHSAAVFHGIFRPLWGSCSNLQCFVVPSAGVADETPVLITDNMVMERTTFNLRVTPVIAEQAFIEKHPEMVERHIRGSMDVADFPERSMHVIFSTVLPCSMYTSMFMRELVEDLAVASAPRLESVV